ncbi:hypothetical protein CRENBAI_024132 [Crenichthys baileyi]|uniref:Uncharacterized protein n=1 Tax=Crenichthys baileyi TaxID=28760 RepID=A0AAV9QS01_9TELE
MVAEGRNVTLCEPVSVKFLLSKENRKYHIFQSVYVEYFIPKRFRFIRTGLLRRAAVLPVFHFLQCSSSDRVKLSFLRLVVSQLQLANRHSKPLLSLAQILRGE